MEWTYSTDRKRIVLPNGKPKKLKKITGHRFSSVLGLNKYQTPFGAWCEITGLAKLPFEDNKYTIAGKTIEPKQIAYAKTLFPNILSCKEYYGNAFNDYQYSNYKDLNSIFDGVRDFVSTKDDMRTIVMDGECKTSSKPQEWDNNQVPLDYLCQGMLYAYLDKLDRILYVASFLQEIDYAHPENYKVTKDNTKLVVKKLQECYIEIDGEYKNIDKLIEQAEEWWEKYISTGVSPEFDPVKDKEYLDIIRSSKPTEDNELIDVCNNAIALAQTIKELKQTSGIDVLEKELKKIEDDIKNKMIDNDLDICGKYTLKRTIKTKFDEKSFSEKEPKLYEKYSSTSTSYTLTKNLKEEKGE